MESIRQKEVDDKGPPLFSQRWLLPSSAYSRNRSVDNKICD